MVSSSSTGQMSNREKIPQEYKGRMTWDPDYRDQVRAQYSCESDDDSAEDEKHDQSTSEYITTPYVSGGLQSSAPKSPKRPTDFKADNTICGGVRQNGMGNDGFEPVSYKRRTKNGPHNNGKQSRKPRIPRRLNLNLNGDNYAKACFRNREEPTGKVILHKDCNEVEPDKVKLYDYLEELGVRLGSFIRPPQHVKDRTLLLWGTKEAIEKTTRELQEWLRPSKPMRSIVAKPRVEQFAKVYSEISDHKRREHDAIRKKAELYRFQQVPAEGQHFDYEGTFLWPVEEVRPQDILGDGLEALDPVRMAYKCHIIFDHQRALFKVLTNNSNSVRQTLSRIQGIMKEFVARTNRPIVKYYIEPPDPAIHQQAIKIAPFQSPNLGLGAPQVPALAGKSLELEARTSWLRLSADLVAQSNRGIEDALRRTIPNLVFYRGQVRMRVHFGTFGLTVFKWPGTAASISFEDFMKNMAMPGTKGTMIRDLGIKKNATTILEKVHNASNFLQPIDNQIMSLADVVPSFTAYFECQDSEKGSMKLEVEMNKNALDEGLYEKTHASWSRLGRRDNTTPLDVFMIRLDGGPSWRLRASTENNIDSTRINPKMVQFADSVQLEKRTDTRIELTGAKMFRWDTNPGSLPVVSFIQKTSLRFRLVQNMDYTVEISRYDVYGQDNQVNRTEWAATLWNSEWDTELMKNEALGIGESADWDPRVKTFFPAQSGAWTTDGVDRGVLEFLKVVSEVNSFLDDIRRELPHLRC